MNRKRRENRRAFTLLELLVVVTIVVVVSAATLPAVIPAIAHRQVSESARILQATIAGARDAAIRANAPRGIRLFPDPTFPGPATLAANRMVSIEAAPDYNSGRVTIAAVSYPLANPITLPNNQIITKINPLIIQEASQDPVTLLPNEPTSWYWNIRQGDKIRFEDSGRYYTIAGPNLAGIYPNNVERYVNYGPPGNVWNQSPAGLSLPGASVANNPNPLASMSQGRFPEYLIVMNGQDDNGNGWVDEAFDGIDNDGDGFIDPGFDGIDNNGDGVIDDLAELAWALPGFAGEYEEEKFIGNQFSTLAQNGLLNVQYTIFRRPVVSEGAREVPLPQGVVIDLTTWNAAAAVDFSGRPVGGVPERSRLPVDPFTYTVDIMLSPNGQVITAGPGQSSFGGTPTSSIPFYHFWIAEREDVFDTIWIGPNGSNTGPPYFKPYANPQAAQGFRYMLPMPQGTVNYNPQAISSSLPTKLFLKGDRRLVTLFVKSGLVVTNEVESFDGNDVNLPFYGPQVGQRQAQ